MQDKHPGHSEEEEIWIVSINDQIQKNLCSNCYRKEVITRKDQYRNMNTWPEYASAQHSKIEELLKTSLNLAGLQSLSIVIYLLIFSTASSFHSGY